MVLLVHVTYLIGKKDGIGVVGEDGAGINLSRLPLGEKHETIHRSARDRPLWLRWRCMDVAKVARGGARRVVLITMTHLHLEVHHSVLALATSYGHMEAQDSHQCKRTRLLRLHVWICGCLRIIHSSLV